MTSQRVIDGAFNVAVDLLAINAQIAALQVERELELDRYIEHMRSLSDQDLLDTMKALKVLHGVGWAKRLDEAGFECSNIRVLERRLLGTYNDGDGKWRGDFPVAEADYRPTPGTWVVYQLLSRGELVYIGSTGDFLTRLKAHARNKTFDSWRAAKCPSEMDCRDLETALIDRYRPPLNRMIPTPRLELA